jgi:antitoxin component YwqK of YwqJK toxin-antitoxin module
MRYLFSFFLLVALGANAQLKSYIIGQRGDTLNRVDAKGLKQGPWVIHVGELRGEPGYEEEGYFKNDKKEGRWVRYSLQGDKLATENYRWGQKDGRCEYFNNVEDLIRVESWLAANPNSPYDTIPVTDINDPTKIIRYEIVMIEEPSVKHGAWRYYDPGTGRVEKTEQWVLNRLKTKADEEKEEELKPIDPANGTTTAKKTEEKKEKAKPKEVLEYEKKNAGKKKIKVRDGRTGG